MPTLCPEPKLSQPAEGHRIYPYLLGGTTVERVNQVWSTDITIRMAHGFVYLVAVMDWFNRFVLSWSLSLTMEVEFCIEALSLIISLMQISGIREDFRGLRGEMNDLRREMNELRRELNTKIDLLTGKVYQLMGHD